MFSKQIALIVDKDRISAETIMRVLKEDLSFKKVIIVPDGKSANDELKKEEIDWVFGEWDLPDMPGSQLLKDLRNNPKTMDVSYIMLSGQVNRQSLSDAVSLGATEFIAKPFTPAIINAKVKRIMSFKEKRIAPRVVPNKKYSVAFYLDDNYKLEGAIANISATGLLVSLLRIQRSGLNIFEMKDLEITFDGGVIIHLQGCLVKMECDYDPAFEPETHILCAFDFRGITNQNRVILNDFINEQRRISLLK